MYNNYKDPEIINIKYEMKKKRNCILNRYQRNQSKQDKTLVIEKIKYLLCIKKKWSNSLITIHLLFLNNRFIFKSGAVNRRSNIHG